MKHFTIDTENNITVHTSRNAARATEAGVFASEVQFADLIGPDNKRLVEIWNNLPGIKPLTKFTGRKVATKRIWKAIQGIGAPAISAAPSKPQVSVATVSAQAPHVASNVAMPGKTSKRPPEGEPEPKGTRGRKTAQVIAMLQRKNGATLSEIMTTIGLQRHAVRGFMAGTMKKAGYAVESFKSGKGERTYQINRSIEPFPAPARRRRSGLSSSGRGVVRISLAGSLASPAS